MSLTIKNKSLSKCSKYEFNVVIQNKADIIEINREENIENSKSEEPNLDDSKSAIKTFLEESNYSNVPHYDVSKLLNTHGFTFNELQTLISYISKDKRYFLLGIIGTIVRGIDNDSFKVALNYKLKSFKEMVDELSALRPNEEKSKNISSLIDMIYSVLPFRIIPLINFTIDINNLYIEHNGKSIVRDEVIVEANSKKAQFYSKFIGIDNPTHESLVIVNKLFEFGIPYQRVKPYLKEITDNIPNKFSIHDIKNVINISDKMNDLRVYFE